MAQSEYSVTREDKKYERYFQLPIKYVANPERLLKAVAYHAGAGNFDIEVSTRSFNMTINHTDFATDAT
jgi:hypothetical protein